MHLYNQQYENKECLKIKLPLIQEEYKFYCCKYYLVSIVVVLTKAGKI